MRTFLTKIARFTLIGVIPFIAAIGLYVALDPFRVVRTYDPIFEINGEGGVTLNRNHVGTVTLLSNYDDREYDSFIFGNSRSFVYAVSDWRPHLTEAKNCFHYNAPNETLYGITKKIEFLDKRGLTLRNVLLVIDSETLSRPNHMNSGHLFILPPQVVDNENIIEFHLSFLRAFFQPQFLLAYADYKLSGKVKPYMTKDMLLNLSRQSYDASSNELRMDYYEEQIKREEYFTPARMEVFYERDTVETFYPRAIAESQKSQLETIIKIFEKHGTNYRIVVSPSYDQKRMDADDLESLYDLFGSHNVFDYSGRNHFTEDYRNFYENVHYRAPVARDIMKEIYRSREQEPRTTQLANTVILE